MTQSLNYIPLLDKYIVVQLKKYKHSMVISFNEINRKVLLHDGSLVFGSQGIIKVLLLVVVFNWRNMGDTIVQGFCNTDAVQAV